MERDELPNYKYGKDGDQFSVSFYATLTIANITYFDFDYFKQKLIWSGPAVTQTLPLTILRFQCSSLS